jgi:hypothetical protein
MFDASCVVTTHLDASTVVFVELVGRAARPSSSFEGCAIKLSHYLE